MESIDFEERKTKQWNCLEQLKKWRKMCKNRWKTLTFWNDRRMVGIKHELNANERYSKNIHIKIVAMIVRLLKFENIVHHQDRQRPNKWHTHRLYCLDNLIWKRKNNKQTTNCWWFLVRRAFDNTNFPSVNNVIWSLVLRFPHTDTHTRWHWHWHTHTHSAMRKKLIRNAVPFDYSDAWRLKHHPPCVVVSRLCHHMRITTFDW